MIELVIPAWAFWLIFGLYLFSAALTSFGSNAARVLLDLMKMADAALIDHGKHREIDG